MGNICWKIKHSHWYGGDWKGVKKVGMPYKEVQHKNPKEKTTSLLKLSTRPKIAQRFMLEQSTLELSIERTYFTLMLHHL